MLLCHASVPSRVPLSSHLALVGCLSELQPLLLHAGGAGGGRGAAAPPLPVHCSTAPSLNHTVHTLEVVWGCRQLLRVLLLCASRIAEASKSTSRSSRPLHARRTRCCCCCERPFLGAGTRFRSVIGTLGHTGRTACLFAATGEAKSVLGCPRPGAVDWGTEGVYRLQEVRNIARHISKQKRI